MVRLLDDAARLGDPHQISGTLAWNDSRRWRPEAKVPPARGKGSSAISAAAAAAVGGRRKGEMASTNEAAVERPVQSVPEFGGCRGISATNPAITT